MSILLRLVAKLFVSAAAGDAAESGVHRWKGSIRFRLSKISIVRQVGAVASDLFESKPGGRRILSGHRDAAGVAPHFFRKPSIH
jgi:hypothetical protein